MQRGSVCLTSFLSDSTGRETNLVCVCMCVYLNIYIYKLVFECILMEHSVLFPGYKGKFARIYLEIH